MKKTYLFDFDGTLVDSMPTYGGLMLRILDENNIPVTHQLQITSAMPSNANILVNGIDNAFTWTSSDTTIATVSETGLVTALKPGEVVITATSKDLGEVYVVDEILNREFPLIFLGYSPKKDCMFTFNMSDFERDYYAEYVVFETSFNQINRSCNREIQAIELMYEASLNNDLYIFMVDTEGEIDFERTSFDELIKNQIPKCGTYFKYNKDRINRLKI